MIFMAMIKGIPIILYEKKQIGTDGFNRPIFEEIPIIIENVLVAPTSATDVVSALNLTGKKAVYTLAIPKDDQHVWEDRKVGFFGEKWRTLGIPLEGIRENIPLDWNKKVMVERYG